MIKSANQAGEKEKIEPKINSIVAGRMVLNFKIPFWEIKLLKPIAISKDKANVKIAAAHLL